MKLLKYSTPIKKHINIWEFPHLSIKYVSPVSVYSLFPSKAIPPLVLCIPSVLDFSRIFQLSLSTLCSSSILLLMWDISSVYINMFLHFLAFISLPLNTTLVLWFPLWQNFFKIFIDSYCFHFFTTHSLSPTYHNRALILQCLHCFQVQWPIFNPHLNRPPINTWHNWPLPYSFYYPLLRTFLNC